MMTWAEVKAALEAKGLRDTDEVLCIDIRCWDDDKKPGWEVRVLNEATETEPRCVDVW